MLHMQQILPKGKCSRFYRDLVEMPHEFARREDTQQVSYYMYIPQVLLVDGISSARLAQHKLLCIQYRADLDSCI